MNRRRVGSLAFILGTSGIGVWQSFSVRADRYVTVAAEPAAAGCLASISTVLQKGFNPQNSSNAPIRPAAVAMIDIE
jgi:hypothetical protein